MLAWIFFRAENAMTGLAMGLPELLTAAGLLALLPMLEALPTLTGESVKGTALQPNRVVTLYFLLITAVVLCRCIALTQGDGAE